ncbi:MAG: ABC transporter ATP-binding protein [Lachnospiraceae bacterium]|nr:ABC transporter ATP-binding protein [Lachnospiraceae bacterium]
MLEIKNLNKSFGRFKAVNNLSMTIGDGELFGFVGANGAGKTTTMKICVGLLAADSGEVIIDGQNTLSGGRALRNKVGYVPDFFGVYDNLTAIEYLQFFAGANGIWGSKSLPLCESLLELVNLKDKRDTQVDSLSRGMKQRLCLARALVHNPDILFLDEPASGLDPKARFELKEILRNLSGMGKTIVISSHILPELIEMCSSLGIISHGELKFNGSVEDAMLLSSGSITLEAVVTDATEKAALLIKETPSVVSCELVGNKFNIGFSGADEDITALMKKLIMNDIPLISFNKKVENVENIFINIMEGGNINAEN